MVVYESKLSGPLEDSPDDSGSQMPAEFPAKPWRRFLAAAIDTAIVGVIVVLTQACLLALGLYSDRLSAILTCTLPIVVWLTVLGFWTFGATPGMRLLRIKIVTIDGSRPGVGVATKRVFGFILASIPFKLGLIPILTHPLRQGWHDQIAGTLVVDRAQTTVPNNLPFPTKHDPGAGLTPPDLKRALKGLPIAFVLAFLTTVCVTWPMAIEFRTNIAGAGGDNSVFAWSAWFINYALDHHLPLIETNLLFYPQQVTLLSNTMDWLPGFLIRPILERYGVLTAYNVEWFATLILCQVSGYFLAASLLRSRAAGLSVMPIYGLSPFFMAHALGHLNIISAEFLPLFLLFVYSSLTNRSILHGAVAGVFLGLAALCDLEYLIMGVTGGCVLLIAFWWRSRIPSWRYLRTQIGSIAACAIAVLCVAGWLIVPTVRLPARPGFMQRQIQTYSIPEDYLSPSGLQSYDKPSTITPGQMPVGSVEEIVTPGFLALILLTAGVFARKRQTYPWAIMGLTTLLFSFGNIVSSSLPSIGSLPTLILTGFPGQSFGLPWDFETLVSQSLLVAGGRISLGGWPEAIWTPWVLLRKMIPFLSVFRDANRFDLLILIAVCLLAGCGANAIFDWVSKRMGRAAASFCVAGIFVAICAEYASVPYPSYKWDIGPVIKQVGATCGPGVHPVLNIPLDINDHYLVEQTFYQQPNYEGLLAITPPEAYDFIKQNDLLKFAQLKGRIGVDSEVYTSKFTPASLKTALIELEAQGMDVALIHKDSMKAADVAQDRVVLEQWLHASKIAEDSHDILYKFSPKNGNILEQATINSAGSHSADSLASISPTGH